MRRRVTAVGSVCLCVCLSVKSHLTSGASVRPENTVVYSAGNGGQKICGVFFETESYGVKRKLKSQLLIKSSLLWLTRDQVFLLDVQRITSGYCMREYKHGYCSGQSNSASSSAQSQPCFSIARAFPAFAHAFKDSRTRGHRGFCTLVHSFYLKCHVEQESIIAEGSDDRLKARSNVFIHSLYSPSTVSQYILSPVYLSGG